MRYLSVIAAILACFFAIVHAFAADNVRVKIGWEYKDFPTSVNIFEPLEGARLWDTRSVASMGNVPAGGKIADSSFTMMPGRNKRFVLVIRNDSDTPLYFFAAPHSVQPVENSLGFKFKCLCINHAFKIEPRQTWYRVVELRLSKDFTGKELNISHTIIRTDPDHGEAFSLEHSGMEP